jgi:hypothetical protein
MAKDFTVERPSPKWVLNKDGVLVQFADNFPSFEFNLNGTYKGMLVEPQSVNLCLQSEDFSTTWNNGNNRLTITTNATTAPDGTTTADEVEVTTTGVIRLSQAFTGLTAGDKYTFSFFAKKSDSGNTVVAFITNFGETKFSQKVINLDTLNVTSSGTNSYPFTFTTRDYGNGWIRIECKTEIPAGQTTLKVNCFPGSKSTATETGANAFFWGAQLEKGDKPTSYIKTTNETVTRNEDVITMSDASQYIPSEGAVIMEWEQREDDTIYIGALNAPVTAGVRKLRFEYSSTEQKLFIDDFETAVAQTTGDFDFSGMDKIELGHVNGVDQPNTHIRYFAIV